MKNFPSSKLCKVCGEKMYCKIFIFTFLWSACIYYRWKYGEDCFVCAGTFNVIFLLLDIRESWQFISYFLSIRMMSLKMFVSWNLNIKQGQDIWRLLSWWYFEILHFSSHQTRILENLEIISWIGEKASLYLEGSWPLSNLMFP